MTQSEKEIAINCIRLALAEDDEQILFTKEEYKLMFCFLKKMILKFYKINDRKNKTQIRARVRATGDLNK